MTIEPWKDIVVLAGDDVTNLVDSYSKVIKPGPGLLLKEDKFIATKSGLLKYYEPHSFWVEFQQKRYVPAKGDRVIGVVTAKQGDFYRVDICGSDQAMLNSLAFEGASKRNRPNVQVGDLIYGKLVVAHRDIEPELSCVDQLNGKAKGMGILQNSAGTGYMFRVSLNLARRLLVKDCPLLSTLGARLPFEVTVGMNGCVFVASSTHVKVIAVMNLIQAAEHLSDGDVQKKLNALCSH